VAPSGTVASLQAVRERERAVRARKERMEARDARDVREGRERVGLNVDPSGRAHASAGASREGAAAKDEDAAAQAIHATRALVVESTHRSGMAGALAGARRVTRAEPGTAHQQSRVTAASSSGAILRIWSARQSASVEMGERRCAHRRHVARWRGGLGDGD